MQSLTLLPAPCVLLQTTTGYRVEVVTVRKLEFETDAFAFADKVRAVRTVWCGQRAAVTSHIKQLAVRSPREGEQGVLASGALLPQLGAGGASRSEQCCHNHVRVLAAAKVREGACPVVGSSLAMADPSQPVCVCLCMCVFAAGG